MTAFLPINLKQWIDEHKAQLKPPVCNQVVWQDREFIIMVVGGPNARDDYHVNQDEEFFYQLKGKMNLKVIDEGKPKDIFIEAGDIFLLPAKVPHSPQRFDDSIGLVVEHKRAKKVKDGFQWYCKNCHSLLYEEYVHVHDIVKQLPIIFSHFYNNDKHTKCKNCGIKNGKAT